MTKPGKSKALGALRTVVFAAVVASTAPASAAGPDVSGMTLILEDNFNGTTLDTSKWHLGSEPNGSQWGSSSYFATSRDVSLLSKIYIVEKGVLTIRATYDPTFVDPVPWKQQWYSGLISTAFADGRPPSAAFRKGCVEISAKFPAGAGSWPGFWALNLASMQKGGDPLGQIEIDGLEQYGHDPYRFRAGLHDWKTKAQTGLPSPQLADLTADFHVYDFCLTDKDLVVYFDGAIYGSAPLYRPDTMGKVFWMFNLAIGGGWPITVPPEQHYDLLIDYIRVWSADPDAVPARR